MAAAEDAVVGDGLGNARGQHQRRTGRQAVDQQQVALARCHQHHAHHHRDLEAAEGGEHLDGVGDTTVPRLRFLHDVQAVGDAANVGQRAGHDEVAHCGLRQARQHHRRTLARAHAHAGEHHGVAAQLVTELHARAHASVRLLKAHGAGDAGVARAVRDLAHEQPLVGGQVFGNAAIDDAEIEVLHAREHGERKLAFHELGHHVARARAVGATDAVDSDAMVGGEDQQLRFVEARLERALHQTQAHRQRFEFTEAATAGVAPLQLFLQGLFEQGVGGRRNERTIGGHGAV